jgi:hypothetical protein
LDVLAPDLLLLLLLLLLLFFSNFALVNADSILLVSKHIHFSEVLIGKIFEINQRHSYLMQIAGTLMVGVVGR